MSNITVLREKLFLSSYASSFHKEKLKTKELEFFDIKNT